MPMTMSDDGCLVRRKMFSDLSKRHMLNPKTWQEKGTGAPQVSVGDAAVVQVRRTATASRSGRCPHWPMRSKSSPLTASSKRVGAKLCQARARREERR